MIKIMLAAAFALMAAFPAMSQEAPRWSPEPSYPTDVVIGDASAPVTVYEYASLTCPHCARFHGESLQAFKEGWIDTGKARLVLRHLPLDQSALAAALTVSCVDQEHRPALVSDLFGSVDEWAPKQDMAPPVKRVLGDGADFPAILSCMSAKGFPEQVMQPGTDAVNNGVEQTPTFFVGGTKAAGFQSAEQLGKLVDDAIAADLVRH